MKNADELLKLADRLSKAAYAAIDAQRRYDYWTQFQTNSNRAKKAEERLDACMKALEAADEELAQAKRERGVPLI